MGIFNFLKGDDSNEIRSAVEVLSADGHTAVDIAEKLNVPVQRVAAFLKTVQNNARDKQQKSKGNEQQQPSDEIKKARDELAISKLKLEQEKILQELREERDVVNKQVEKARLEGELETFRVKVDVAKRELQNLEEDIADAREELKELEDECEKAGVRLDGGESDPMSMMLQGFMSNAMQKAQQSPTAPPVQTALAPEQTTLTPQPAPTPQPEQKTAPEPSYDVEKEADELLARMSPAQKAYAKTAGKEEVIEFARVNGIPKDIALTAWKKNKKVK